MTGSLLSAATLVSLLLFIAGALVWYALYRKGDVRAEFAHGKTVFKLEAKDRRRK